MLTFPNVAAVLRCWPEAGLPRWISIMTYSNCSRGRMIFPVSLCINVSSDNLRYILLAHDLNLPILLEADSFGSPMSPNSSGEGRVPDLWNSAISSYCFVVRTPPRSPLFCGVSVEVIFARSTLLEHGRRKINGVEPRFDSESHASESECGYPPEYEKTRGQSLADSSISRKEIEFTNVICIHFCYFSSISY